MADTARVAEFVRDSNITGSLLVVTEPLVWGFIANLKKHECPYSDAERDAFVEKARAHLRERLYTLAIEHYRQVLTNEEVDQLLALIQSPLYQKVEATCLNMQADLEPLTKSIEQELTAYAETLGQTAAERPCHH